MSNRHCLTAHAIGDAIGKPFETQAPKSAEIMQWLQDPRYLGSDYEALGDEGKKPGRFTDDTQMCICAVRAMQDGGNLEDRCKTLYQAWHQGWPSRFAINGHDKWKREDVPVVAGLSGPTRGIGGTVDAAMRHHKNYAFAFKNLGDTANCYVGNGVAMRCTPFGVYFRNNLQALADAIEKDSYITHDHAESVAGALAVSATIAISLRDEATIETIDQVLALLRSEELHHTAVYAAVKGVRRQLLSQWSPLAGNRIEQLCEIGLSFGNTGYIVDTISSALYLGMCFDSPQTILSASIAMGGDTDTRAALTSAIYASRNGVEEYPTAWRIDIEHVDLLSIYDAWLTEHPFTENR